ncbi:hypothetical protein [Streptomyces sp. NPDC001980]|uniref:hypothetical protein n=1 Tax=Streptomyces sp. NPDC001980 TaxID=3157126 RepID=UPI0033301EAC
MPSAVGLLEQRELVARRRVNELREEADRIQTEPALAERDREEWTIARSQVDEALRPKAKRLVARGRPAERQPGRFTLAQGPAGQGGAS